MCCRVIGVVLFSCAIVLAESDSLSLLFGNENVREYNLSFYEENWAEVLAANYANGGGYLLASFTDGKITLDSIGVKYKGNSSYLGSGSSPKKPLKIKFNAFKNGQKYYGVEKLNFGNNYGDPSFLREKIAYEIAANYLPTPRSSFASISINNEAIGLYTQVEQVDELFLQRRYADGSNNLFKASDAGATLKYVDAQPDSYSDQLELKTNTEIPDWRRMVQLIDFLNNSSEEEFCTTYEKYFDSDNLTRFLALNMALSNFDSYTGSGRNFYIYEAVYGGKINFIPWDLNLAFGGYSNGWNVNSQSLVNTENLEDRPLLAKVISCEELKNKYLAYVRDMVEKSASVDSIEVLIQKYSTLIEPYVIADENKFYSTEDFYTNLSANLRTASGSIPGLSSFAETRSEVVLAEIEAELPADYILDLAFYSLHFSFDLVWENGFITVKSPLVNQKVNLSVVDLVGRKIRADQFIYTNELQPLNLPIGKSLLIVQSSTQKEILLIHNQ